MRATIRPGSPVRGPAEVPGDKSIAHRWLILASVATGRSVLSGLPASLDVTCTARALAGLTPSAGAALRAWAGPVEVEGHGRGRLKPPGAALDCGNSGTTMRLLAGLVAPAPFTTTLTGDDSLLRRPMERVAEPLRAMGAVVETAGGRPPMTITGAPLRGISWEAPVPSAQVKGAVLLAGLAAEGETEVTERAPTRDHTERALAALGAPVTTSGRSVRLRPYQHEGFEAGVPGDVSSAAFLVAAAALTGAEVVIDDVGLNPSRTHFLEVMRRMGVLVAAEEFRSDLGEPIGSLRAGAGSGLRATVITAEEFPLLLDEVPVLSMLAAHAQGESRFEGASELRLKEADRLSGLAEGIRELGGEAAVEGDTLVVAGGGLSGGRTEARGDHRLAMASVVGALAARGPSEVGGMEWAGISFPGFDAVLRSLGADVEVGT